MVVGLVRAHVQRSVSTRGRRVVLAAEHADHAAHLGQRIAAGRSTTSSASSTFSWSGSSSRRTAEAWTVITLTLCPTTSWSSRAIRARSSATASRACSSRSSSACSAAAGSRQWTGSADRKQIRRPTRSRKGDQRPDVVAVGFVFGSLYVITAETACIATSPAIAWRRSGRIPNQAEMPSAVRKAAKLLSMNPASTNEEAPTTTSETSGAAIGNRRRKNRGPKKPSVIRTSTQIGASAPLGSGPFAAIAERDADPDQDERVEPEPAGE